MTPATTIPSPASRTADEPTPSAEATTAAAAATGTREAPLAIGEARKISEDSAWTVSLASVNLDAASAIQAADEYALAPAEGETWVVGTFSIGIDGKALEAQGVDLANEGANEGAKPYHSLTFEYVSADGAASYNENSGTFCSTQNPLRLLGPTYRDGAVMTGDMCIPVPTEKVAGGLWRVSNSVNESVWIRSS